MSTFSGYKTKAFSETQKFFVLDPSTGTPSFVLGSDLVKQLTPNSSYVFAERTRTTAQDTDYALGAIIQTAGDTAVADGGAAYFLVVAAGEGDFPMDNGNELLFLYDENLLREELATNTVTNGSDLVAHTGTTDTVTETLDRHTSEIADRTIFVGNVTELEGLSLPEGVNVYLTEDGRAGEFVVKAGTPPTDIYKGFYIALANGNYAERADKTAATPEMFGAVTDWNGTVGTDIHDIVQAMVDMPDVKIIRGTGNPYYFGNVAQNATQVLVTRDIDIDWQGSLLVCEGDNTVSGTDANLFTFQDCRMKMRNYQFLDTQFTLAGPSRGVMPAHLRAEAATTYGHSLTGFHVQNGQSLITCTSSDPNLFRSDGIEVNGTGEDCYYGANLAGNGDNFSGIYMLNNFNRLWFVYAVKGANIRCNGVTGQPSSSNGFVSALGAGFPDTENVSVKARIEVLDGPMVIADQSSADGTGVYKDINLSLSFGALGDNLTASDSIVRIGAFDVGGNYYTVEKSITTEDVKVDIKPGSSVPLLDFPVKVFTPSPNYGLLSLSESTPYEISGMYPKNASNIPLGPTLYVSGRYSNSAHGDLTQIGNTAIIPTRFIAARKKNYEVIGQLRVTLRNNVGGANEYAYKVFSIIGTLSSTGALTVNKATEIESNINGALTPVVTVAASTSGMGLEVSATAYTGAFANLVASMSWV